MDYWAGCFDYSKGFLPNEIYENYIITISDEDKTPISLLISFEEFKINLDKNGNYAFDN